MALFFFRCRLVCCRTVRGYPQRRAPPSGQHHGRSRRQAVAPLPDPYLPGPVPERGLPAGDRGDLLWHQEWRGLRDPHLPVRQGSRGRSLCRHSRTEGSSIMPLGRQVSVKHVQHVITCYLLAVVILLGLCIHAVDACPELASAPHSRWQVTAHNGVFWLLTPCGERFFSVGVNVLNSGYPERQFQGRLAYHWGTFYPDLAGWAQSARQRVLAWGFNTAGAWSSHPNMLGLPIIPDLELGREASYHWFDPFQPSMAEELRTWAHRLVAPYKGNPYRIGYFSDNEVGWWNGAMWTYYLKQPATNHTKQQLLTLVRDYYGHDWERFARDFVPPPEVKSFDDLLQCSGEVTQLRPAGEGMRLIRRWVGVVAEQYYRLTSRAIREADPDALIFGDRLQIYYDPDAVRAMVPYVDVVATNYDVDSPDGWIARYYFDGLRQLTGNKPVLISEWFFAARDNRTGNRNNGHLMTVQTQAERTRGAAAAARQVGELPPGGGGHG